MQATKTIQKPIAPTVGAASCRPQIGMNNKDNGLTQAQAAGCRPYKNLASPKRQMHRFATIAACVAVLLFAAWAIPSFINSPAIFNGGAGLSGQEGPPGTNGTYPVNGQQNGEDSTAATNGQDAQTGTGPVVPQTLYALTFNTVQAEMSASMLPPDFSHELTSEQFAAIFPTLDPSRFAANATYWVTHMQMAEVSAHDPNGQASIRLGEGNVSQGFLVMDEVVHISYVHGIEVTASIQPLRRYK